MDQVELFGLHGTHVVVTGASGGIGLATVELFYNLGARITAHGNTNTSALKGLSERLQNQLNIVAADGTKETDVISFYEAAKECYGPPDVLVGIHMPRMKLTRSLSWDFRDFRAFHR
jgi:NAD(P)-dependent dehydrogenase (short-subunit alcohol dehydrogenase family)